MCPVFVISVCRAGAEFGMDVVRCCLSDNPNFLQFFALHFESLMQLYNCLNVGVKSVNSDIC